MIRGHREAWSGVVRTGLSAEGGRVSRGEGSGRDVEARNDHGRSLWPTAKRFCSPSRMTHLLSFPTHAHSPHGPVKGTKQRGIAIGSPRRARDASSTTAPSFDMTTDFGEDDSLPSRVVRSMTPT